MIWIFNDLLQYFSNIISLILEVLHNCSRHLEIESRACAKSYYHGAKGIYEATMHENNKNYYDHTDRKNYIHYCIVDRTWKVNQIKLNI